MRQTPTTYLLITGLTAVLAGCGAEGTADEGAEPPDQSTLLLSETFADEGLLQVAADDRGNIGVAVQAKEGSTAARLIRTTGFAGSLKELYLQLKGGSEVPEHVVSVSDARDVQMREASLRKPPAASPSSTPPSSSLADDAIGAVKSAAAGATESSFYSTVCVSFAVSIHRYSVSSCTFNVGYSVKTGFTVDSHGSIYDRVYGWNHAAHPARYALSGTTWTPRQEEYSFGWVEWGGTYTNSQAALRVTPTEATIPTPELGITHHIHTVKLF